MKVYIVAEVEAIGPGIENDYIVADSLAQTLGGEVGTMMFETEEDVEGEPRRAIYRLTRIGPYPGEVVEIAAHHQAMYPVDALSGEVESLMVLPAKRWEP